MDAALGQVAAVIQQDLAKLGIEVSLRQEAFRTVISRVMRSKDYHETLAYVTVNEAKDAVEKRIAKFQNVKDRATIEKQVKGLANELWTALKNTMTTLRLETSGIGPEILRTLEAMVGKMFLKVSG